MEGPANNSPATDVVWEPCGTCWGQRVIWHPTFAGPMHRESCPTCIGVGQRAVLVPATTPRRMAA
jgi:hypothetical protein